MGFYDRRCMVTGVSLMGVDAVLVPLSPADGVYRPISVGFTGNYDRLGGVDGIVPDLNTDLVRRYFLDRVRDGRAVLRDATSGMTVDAGTPDEELPGDIEDLLLYFERTNILLECPPVVGEPTTLDGALIGFALVARPVWSALTTGAAPEVDHLSSLAGTSPVLGEIYGGHAADTAGPARELFLVDAYLAEHGRGWELCGDPERRYPDEPGQHDDEVMRRLLAEAKSDFAGDAVIGGALDAYRREYHDLLHAAG